MGGKLWWLKNKYGYYESLQMLLDLQVELIYNEHNKLFVEDEQELEEIPVIIKNIIVSQKNIDKLKERWFWILMSQKISQARNPLMKRCVF